MAKKKVETAPEAEVKKVETADVKAPEEKKTAVKK